MTKKGRGSFVLSLVYVDLLRRLLSPAQNFRRRVIRRQQGKRVRNSVKQNQIHFLIWLHNNTSYGKNI